MSNHKLLKVKNNEVAIHFTSDSGIQFIVGEGQLEHIEISRAFAICYALTSMPRIYEIFRQILRNDLILQKKEIVDVNKRLKMQQLIDLLTVSEDDKEEEPTADLTDNVKIVWSEDKNTKE